MNKSLPKNIYWEKQGVDMLCGVHSINSLLQGKFFDQVTLAHIALELDKKQHQLMQEQGMTNEFLKYMQEDSGNVAMSGNYSIQVLVEALKQHNLNMISIGTIDKDEDLTKKTGFICNNAAHWFTIRKIDGIWYNLNSTNKRLPQIISDFYLAAFLHSVQQCGYQIFSVQGDYPESSQNMWDFYNDNQFWLEPKRILKYHEKASKRKGYKPNISGAGDDKQMQKAIAASLGKKYVQYESSGEDQDWDKPQGKKQIKAFTGHGAFIGDEVFVNYQKFMLPNDPQIYTCFKMSLQEEFSTQLKQGILVALRYPNGKKQRRYFKQNASIQAIYDYIWINRSPLSHFYLVNGQTKQKLVDVTIPINVLTVDNEVSVFVTDM